MQEKSTLRNVFDTFDAKNQGKFSVSDLASIIEKMGGDPKRFVWLLLEHLVYIFLIDLFQQYNQI